MITYVTQPLSLVCSVPHFNALAPDEITTLVAASSREHMRPGESKALASAAALLTHEQFFIVISGNLALAHVAADDAAVVKQAALLPTTRLGIGDFFTSHLASEMKVLALEPVECLVIPMSVITELSPTLRQLLQAETSDASCEASETESFKQWALQFAIVSTKCESPSAVDGGLAQCSVKAFCKDHFPHMSPENELDHTLEHTRAALTTIFNARRVRVYAVDTLNARVIVKVSERVRE